MFHDHPTATVVNVFCVLGKPICVVKESPARILPLLKRTDLAGEP